MEKFNSYIICLNTSIVYQGVRQAERILGIDHSNLSKVCKGMRNSINGLKFEYFNPEKHKNYKYYNYYDRSNDDPSV